MPLPRTSYDERMDLRSKTMGGVKLLERRCARTGQQLVTSLPSDYPGEVWHKEVFDREFS